MSDKPIQSPSRSVTTTIDADRCIGCGQCVAVCPKETITMEAGKAVITGSESLNCGHCAAACPAEAIQVRALDLELGQFANFSANNRWLPPGRFDTAALVNLMGSRRSCRNFTEQPVDGTLLEDLVKIGITAPSGSNCQPWTFTILPDRRAVIALAQLVGGFFRKTNRMAEKAWLRRGLKWLGRPELETYYGEYYATVKRGLEQWDRGQRDLLFHGAPAAIVVAADKDASCPAEDALLATGHMLLGAHSLGLGTCLIGFVIEAMRREKTIARSLGIPDNEIPCAVMAVGWPDETYRQVAGRKPVTIRYAGPRCIRPAGMA